jgi:hypothetical protein
MDPDRSDRSGTTSSKAVIGAVDSCERFYFWHI